MSGNEQNSGYARLDDEIEWYDKKSVSAQNWYKRAKMAELVLAASVPPLAFVTPVITAIAGAAIVVLEGLVQLNQWAQTWITYRSTCEALRHEKYSYLGRSGAYAAAASDMEAKQMLVERVEGLISTEHAKWISQQEYAVKAMRKTTPHG